MRLLSCRMPIWIAALAAFFYPAAQGSRFARVAGHVPLRQLAQARHLGRVAARTSLDLAIVLKARDPSGLADLIRRQQDPADPEYGRYLTPEQFRDRFAPTEVQVGEVLDFLRAEGLSNLRVHPNRLVVNATAPAEEVERAFSLELHEYTTRDGRRARAATQDPELRAELAGRVHAVTGLSTFRRWKHQAGPKSRVEAADLDPRAARLLMTPSRIKSAYGLSTSATAGSGQHVALFELDGFNSSDPAAYASAFSITAPTITTILVDGVTGAAGSDQDEVNLDIEMVMAVSPGVSSIKVYEGPNTDSGVINTYSRIANDNSAKNVSTSWGLSEDEDTASFLNAENTIFQQMATQGQSIFAAAGDAGAFDNSTRPTTLLVDDPASQPYVTGVGGTTLTMSGVSYSSETTWGSGSLGGGGGVSAIWPIPSYQSGLGTFSNKGSGIQRMVPDVAFNADPNTGYYVVTQGGSFQIGGTSAAAPIWAAIMAQVNSARITNGLSTLGFANTPLYQLAKSSLYATTFHDIADGSTNLFFPARTGYDLATGLGTPIGAALVSALSAASLPPAPPTNVATTDAGGGTVTVSWTASSGATSYEVFRCATFGGAYTSQGTTAGTSFNDSAGASSFYYLVKAINAAGTSGASDKKAGGSPLATPGAASGLGGSGAP